MTKAPDCKSKLTGWLCSFTLTWIPALDSKLVGWLCSFTLTWIPALDQSTGLWLKAYCMTVFIHFNMNPSSWPKHRTVTQSWLDDCVHSLQCESKSWLDICYSKLVGWLCSFTSVWIPKLIGYMLLKAGWMIVFIQFNMKPSCQMKHSQPWLWLCHNTDTSNNTKPMFKSCHVLHTYVGTIFSHD